ncbi:hypothetical protein B7C42_08367 [Nocardia cerradoensis]|uniref:Uncharacterized protein n=1 Tax=Nocardia cerradoensis TaxID=85688 RepID=A0A231GSP0_9NOCA|nr:hypothetical protein [Nocardia cerradoensis]OXR39565.1 hypothetical protein B7C42_08367 [Nocardia cerradoensis]
MLATQSISVRIAAATAVLATALLTGAGAAAAAEPDRQAEPTSVAPRGPQHLLHQFVTGIIGATGSQCSFDTRPDCGK